MKGVEQLLAELREHGTIDSQGEFTLSLSEARRKLVQYQSSEKARYLLLLLSAGTAAGARSLAIEQTSPVCRLSMPGAHIPESALLSAFAHPERPSAAPGACDLVLGLQGAFHNGASRVEVRVQKPGESFVWTLEARSEQSTPIDSAGVTGLEVVLHLKRDLGQTLRGVLGWLRGGYAAKSEEARLLDRYCDRSLITLTYNGESIDRPLFLPALSVLATVGELGEKRLEFKPDAQLSGYGWRAALALGPGPIQIVLQGVAYCQIENLGLVGTVYHDGLERDISREKIVRDKTYEALLRELETVRVELSTTLVAKMDSVEWPLLAAQLPELVYLFLSRKLDGQSRQALWEGMERLYRRRAEGEAHGFTPSPSGLIDFMMALTEDITARRRVLELLLLDCGEGLRERPVHFHKQLEMTHQVFRAHHPDESLVLGYLLLGLGALHAVEGRKQESERAWFRALETVWSGTNERAQELMYAHMGYAPEHILQQASTALAMYCSEQGLD